MDACKYFLLHLHKHSISLQLNEGVMEQGREEKEELTHAISIALTGHYGHKLQTTQ